MPEAWSVHTTGSEGALPSPTADVRLLCGHTSVPKNGYETARGLDMTPTKVSCRHPFCRLDVDES